MDILFDQYIKFKATSDHVISIAVSTCLERFKEENVDDAEDSKKKKIVREIVFIYNNTQVPSVSDTEYLISELLECDICKCKNLVTVRPNSKGRTAVLYSQNGGRAAIVFNKHCP